MFDLTNFLSYLLVTTKTNMRKMRKYLIMGMRNQKTHNNGNDVEKEEKDLLKKSKTLSS